MGIKSAREENFKKLDNIDDAFRKARYERTIPLPRERRTPVTDSYKRESVDATVYLMKMESADLDAREEAIKTKEIELFQRESAVMADEARLRAANADLAIRRSEIRKMRKEAEAVVSQQQGVILPNYLFEISSPTFDEDVTAGKEEALEKKPGGGNALKYLYEEAMAAKSAAAGDGEPGKMGKALEKKPKTFVIECEAEDEDIPWLIPEHDERKVRALNAKRA